MGALKPEDAVATDYTDKRKVREAVARESEQVYKDLQVDYVYCHKCGLGKTFPRVFGVRQTNEPEKPARDYAMTHAVLCGGVVNG